MAKRGTNIFLEYRGGYALVSERDLISVIQGYKHGTLKKDALRIFAALLEKSALHEKSRVDLCRILNCKAREKGIKRLRAGEIAEGEAALQRALQPATEATGRFKAVSRVALRAIAQGRVRCTEAIVFLMYSARRISQRKPLKRLLPDERYARFTYRELSELSGIPRANISRAVSRLKRQGFLQTVWVVKQNENQFGLLFVDGPVLTLVAGATADRSRPHKSTTPSTQINTAPAIKLPTLKNSYPKTDMKKNNELEVGRREGNFSDDWLRIMERARVMKENLTEQAA